jgi:hypothetical protein
VFSGPVVIAIFGVLGATGPAVYLSERYSAGDGDGENPAAEALAFGLSGVVGIPLLVLIFVFSFLVPSGILAPSGILDLIVFGFRRLIGAS